MCHFTLLYPKGPINKNLSYLTFRVITLIYELLHKPESRGQNHKTFAFHGMVSVCVLRSAAKRFLGEFIVPLEYKFFCIIHFVQLE